MRRLDASVLGKSNYWYAVIACLVIGMAGWYCLPISCLVVVAAAGLFFLSSANAPTRQWRGTGYFGQRSRILAVTAANDGKLAISLQDQGSTRIAVIQEAAAPCPVSNGGYDADPAWDPSGTRIAYVSRVRDSRLAIHVIDLQEHCDSLILESDLVSQPQWTNDGRHLLFLKGQPGKFNDLDICAIELATGSVTLLARTHIDRTQAFCLLPGEPRIAYIDHEGVWIKPLTAEKATRLPIDLEDPCMVSASRDGELLFICDAKSNLNKTALIANLRTGEVYPIFQGFVRWALWSPCDRWLAIPGYYDTCVFDVSACCGPPDYPEHAHSIEGVAVCWCSPSNLVVMRPNMRERRYLDVVELPSGVTTRLYSVSSG